MNSNRSLAALAAALVLATAPVTSAQNLDQGWSAEQQKLWYELGQGSRLMPLAWFKALEQAGGTQMFLDDANIERFRYIPRHTATNGGLPLGFAVDTSSDEHFGLTRLRWKSGQGEKEPWVGLTCSACHTAKIRFGTTSLLIDGGPTLADFQSFLEKINESLEATQAEPDRFARFAGRVLGTADTAENQALLKESLAKLLEFQRRIEKLNETTIRYGFARLDAFGRIYNKVTAVSGASSPTANPSNAPVSYPFLWNVPQHDRVQWNGIVENKVIEGIGGQPFDFGALGRNTGEVIGVFAEIQPTKNILKGFRSSANVKNLVNLEQQLGSLRPPRWPSVFPPLEASAVATGKALFEAKCQGCHLPLARTDLETPIVAQMSRLNATTLRIDTDPWMACNAYMYSTSSGVLEGFPSKYFTGARLEPTAHLSDMLTVTVAGALLRKKGEVAKTAASSFFGLERPVLSSPGFFTWLSEAFTDLVSNERERIRSLCLTDESPILAYKARPLTGVWATAPYLHNGSVATLYDLLLPPAERPPSFYTGTREYDAKNVGYATTQSAENTFLFETRDAAGEIIDGNSNLGHDYGNGDLTEPQRRALVEYMKGL